MNRQRGLHQAGSGGFVQQTQRLRASQRRKALTELSYAQWVKPALRTCVTQEEHEIPPASTPVTQDAQPIHAANTRVGNDVQDTAYADVKHEMALRHMMAAWHNIVYTTFECSPRVMLPVRAVLNTGEHTMSYDVTLFPPTGRHT